VLIDFERWIAAREREQNVAPNERYRPDTPYAITPDQVRTRTRTRITAHTTARHTLADAMSQVREVARDQGVTFEVGDFLLIRTGWIRWCLNAIVC
jgi:hypothetical protein